MNGNQPLPERFTQRERGVEETLVAWCCLYDGVLGKECSPRMQVIVKLLWGDPPEIVCKLSPDLSLGPAEYLIFRPVARFFDSPTAKKPLFDWQPPTGPVPAGAFLTWKG